MVQTGCFKSKCFHIIPGMNAERQNEERIKRKKSSIVTLDLLMLYYLCYIMSIILATTVVGL